MPPQCFPTHPATTSVPNPPFPKNLTPRERAQLKTFDELDFDVFSHADWARLGESHAQNIRVHWPDGHFTDGIDRHIEDLSAQFVWAPDTHINVHPIRVAKNELTAVTGVMQGTFTRPMPDGKGGFIQPTNKKFSLNMCTVGIWNRRGVMDEEFLFFDNPDVQPADRPGLTAGLRAGAAGPGRAGCHPRWGPAVRQPVVRNQRHQEQRW